MTNNPAPSLTRFAVAVYSMPGVAPVCLQLQSAGQDVCLLLCAAWLYQRQAACTPARAEQLRAASLPWQSAVVTPLRELRQRWKAAAAADDALGALREKLKRLELEAEMALLQRLEAIALPWPAGQASGSSDWLTALASDAGRKKPAELQAVRDSAATWQE